MGGRAKRRRSARGAGLTAFTESAGTASVTDVGSVATVMARADRLRMGDLLAGRYQIEAAIGIGASGRVLRAFDRESRAVVAVKILKPELASDLTWVDRLSRELRVGRQIQHPNVCRVFDVGEADGYRFLTMEIASGGSVGQEIRARQGLPPLPARIADARAIIQGIAALHEAGIVHRDVKPDNILRMADGRLVVSDFGLATDPGVGPSHSILVGTPSYMAPEVAMGEGGSPRSDVFGLGILLHELLFGSRPEWRPGERGERHLVVTPEHGPRIERALAGVCGMCLHTAPASRPPSAEALLDLFDAAVDGRGLGLGLGRGRRAAPRGRAYSWLWGAGLALSVLVLVLGRNRWWSRASASWAPRTLATTPSPVLTPSGTANDWARGATPVASFPGHVSCFALVDGRRKIQIIWGDPRRAEELNLETGQRTLANLLPATYVEGCPELSPDGRNLLFTRTEAEGTDVFMGAAPDGRDARRIVRGSRPKWLPNGDEFLFDLDSRHPGVFSLPTGEMTVIGEGMTGTRQLAEKAIDATGKYIALRYFDDAANSRIFVESQGTFQPEGSIVVPSSALHLGFVGEEQRLTFTLYGDQGTAELVEADWRHGSLRRVGRTPGADIVGVIDAPVGAFVLARKLRLDAWLDSTERPVRLTSDGTSDGGALSAHGDLLVQRFLGDRRYAIALRGVAGGDRLLTSGPMDMSPSFFADSDRWVYSSYKTQQIFQCRLTTGTCAAIHFDSSTPAWPTADPFGDRLAYVTLLNAPRLRVLDLATTASRDLGPVLNDCPPIWLPGGRLWALQSTSPATMWAEFDVATGARTGAIASRASSANRLCQLPPALRAKAERVTPRVFAVADESAELLAHHGAL